MKEVKPIDLVEIVGRTTKVMRHLQADGVDPVEQSHAIYAALVEAWNARGAADVSAIEDRDTTSEIELVYERLIKALDR